MKRVFGPLIVIMVLTMSSGFFAQARIQAAGGWFPSIPDGTGAWEAIIQPVSQDTLALLGYPRAISGEYINHVGDSVLSTLVTAGPFENFHDPTVCIGGNGIWAFTAKKQFLLDGPGSAEVRAMIFQRRDAPKVRIVMYYWQQTQDGHFTCDPMMGNYRDIFARFRTGYGAVVLGRKSVILRIYAPYNESDDPDGKSAQRNVHVISRATYQHLLRMGKQAQ